MNTYDELKFSLNKNGLKVTPQRIAVFEAALALSHPTVDQIFEYVHQKYPGAARGTVYNILESLAEKKLIHKVKADTGSMRYDAILDSHHHLYCSECNKIEDYYDDELNRLLENYFKNKEIKNFRIENIKLQITGKFHFNNK
jgi:Fur family transcriptional regulator, peroxide stress response regulator